MSSPGQARRSGKSINLEANILSEWSGATSIVRQRIRVRLVTLAAVILIGFAALPQLNDVSARAATRATAARARNAQWAKVASELERKAKAGEPMVQASKMLADSKRNLDTMLGNVRLVINSVPTSAAFDTLHVEAMSAQLTLTCKSEAESTSAGQAFVDAASKGPNVMYAVQASTMKSNVLQDDGVAFDFIKRVNLEP
ncbi:MAG TPA: hypothetical protein VKT78_10875 [Fimbriimonadaceae bacterium]|nr:hypothetical protein [Fimbriimonadaceae bacterium]